MQHEFIVYIHGVSDHPSGHRHDSDYQALHEGIKNKLPATSPWRDATVCFTEWGWNFDNDPRPQNHKLLAQAQSSLAERVLESVKEPTDWTVNPLRYPISRFRRLMMYGFSDMFYYVSTDGKNAIRTTVSEQIAKKIGPLLDDPQARISLTLIGHSAGSVIAIDLCFFLFSDQKYTFINQNTAPETYALLQKLQTLTKPDNERIRLRRLITFGSPISMLACRNDRVVELLANDKKLIPEQFGLKENRSFSDHISGPRWINIWDKDDPLAFPIEPLMDSSNNMVKDIYLDISDWLPAAHTGYWSSPKVYRTIAELW